MQMFTHFKANKPTARTKQALSYIQATKPELFTRRSPGVEGGEPRFKPPPGFEACDRPGWLHNADKNVYFSKNTGRLCWLDLDRDVFRDLRQGDALALTFVAAAATRLGASASKQPAPKHVVIPDLHRVAQALRVDVDHLDRPAAMLGVFGIPPDGGVSVDASARGIHEKLVRRLAVFRGEWSNDDMLGAVVGAFSDVALAHRGSCNSQRTASHPQDQQGQSPMAAVALVVGRRVITAAAPGTRVGLLAAATIGSGTTLSCVAISRSSETSDLASSNFELPDFDQPEALYMVLSTGDIQLGEEEAAAVVAPHLSQNRPRAASAALLAAARGNGASGPLTAACARLARVRNAATTVAGLPGALDGRATKRLRISEELPSKVRVRHILLRHWRGEGPKPVDPAHRRPVSRTPEEAEEQMVRVLDGLIADGCAGFSSACRTLSECQSVLKGGELVGDLGWLSPTNSKGPKSAVDPAVPMSVRKAAFELDVGELSDTISSEIGSHLLMRTA
mmetsp:Transcript_106810/g.300247  ORF Transcript_106810/g.300247 Transcript_106810/m.300247 type:complete len:507 (-) Transcript_106810:101-1621(-)